MAQLRPKIVKLAKIIGGVTGITTRIDENAPEYYCMARSEEHTSELQSRE